MTSQGPDERESITARRPTQLLREILEVSEAFEAHLARQLGVNPTDRQAMEHLIQSGPLSPTELSARLGMSAAAVTTVIDRLESVGHVSRSRHPRDRRGVIVAPEPRSVQRAMGTLLPMIGAVDGVLDDLDDAERETVERYLRRVVEVYRAQVAG